MAMRSPVDASDVGMALGAVLLVAGVALAAGPAFALILAGVLLLVGGYLTGRTS